MQIIFGGKQTKMADPLYKTSLLTPFALSSRESLQSVAFVRYASANGTKVHCGKLYCKASRESSCSNSTSGPKPCAPFLAASLVHGANHIARRMRLRYIKFQFHVHLSRLKREAPHGGRGMKRARAVPGVVLGTEVRMSVAELSQGRAARRKLFGQVAWRVDERGRGKEEGSGVMGKPCATQVFAK